MGTSHSGLTSKHKKSSSSSSTSHRHRSSRGHDAPSGDAAGAVVSDQPTREPSDFPKARSESLLTQLNTNILSHPIDTPIEEYYEVTEKSIGVGHFSVVKVGVNKKTGQQVAIKIIDKNAVKSKPEMVSNEIIILFKAKHPSIIDIYDVFETESSITVCMEFVTGGELFDRIVEREQFSEKQARYVMKQLFECLAYLHSLGIVHRDLKPENVLLLNNESDSIKIADFGLSKIYTEDVMSTACGTPGYVAPEILSCNGYDERIDIWSCGVILYIMLCGYPPFYDENDAKLFEAIMAGRYQFQSPYWDDISEEAKDLLSHLLVVDPSKRYSAKIALNHMWFSVDDKKLDNPINEPSFRNRLQRHNSTRKATRMMTMQTK